MSTVLLIGASNDSTRYSSMALNRLLNAGHRVIPLNPYSEITTIEPTIHHLAQVQEEIDIAVIYVRAELLKPDIEELVRIAPATVIFNLVLCQAIADASCWLSRAPAALLVELHSGAMLINQCLTGTQDSCALHRHLLSDRVLRAESLELKNELERNNIRTRNACTLVLLSTGQFDLDQEEERNE